MNQISIAKLSLAEKAVLTAGRDMWSTAAFPQAGVGSMKMADGPMGIASGRVDERDISVLTPCSLALGASWDRALVARIGALVAYEANRRGVSIVLGPNLNLARSPLAGRTFEMFSEDPLLTGLIGTAWIEGLQGQGVGAVAKHLVCNDSETLRNSMNSVVDARALNEVYLLPFELAARAGCAGIMSAYNRVNGVFCVEHRDLLTSVVKERWKFEGFTLSDWFGTLHTLESAAAGLDLEMPGPARFFGSFFETAVEENKVRVERLNDAAARVAAASARYRSNGARVAGGDEVQELLCEAAAAGFVLLKNDAHLLPLLPQEAVRIAVIGPNAMAPCYQGGTFAKIAVDPVMLSPLQALRAQYEPDTLIDYQPGVRPQPRLPSMPVSPARDLGDGLAAGVTVDYFGSHDFSLAPVTSETRNTNSLTWFGGMPGTLLIMDRPAGIRLTGVFTPELTGAHTFLVGGTGSVSMSVDGSVVVSHEQVVLPKDVMGMLKGGDAETATVDLVAGSSVLVRIEFRYTPARAQGVWFGVHTPERAEAMLEQAEEAARAAQAVLLFVGETADASVESKDRDSTYLPASQIALIHAICRVNPKTVVIVNAAHAVDLSWSSEAAAILMVWYPGQQYGNALAQTIAGVREPGGRLPVTIAASEIDYPAFDLTPDANGDLHYEESWKVGYRSAKLDLPAFGFGAGMGYAQFEMSNLVYDVPSDSVRLRVTNTSEREGKEVVQIYTHDTTEGSDVPMLAGFACVSLQAGSLQQIVVPLNPEVFRIWDDEVGQWRPAPNRKRLTAGSSLATVVLEVTRTI